jgi:hypothetical protein
VVSPGGFECLVADLELNRDVGTRAGQAETLNCLGELASRTADGRPARDYHAQALAIAVGLGTPWRKHRPVSKIICHSDVTGTRRAQVTLRVPEWSPSRS